MKAIQSYYHGPLFQYLAAISGSFSIINSGINLAWTSPYLPQLESNTSSIPTTSSEGSWCAVMPLLGAPPGAIIAAILVDRIGRKPMILSTVPIFFSSFIGMAFAANIWLLSGLRFIIGAAEGALYTALPMYIGEIAAPERRGILTTTITLFAIVGVLFINILGTRTSIFTSSLISASIGLIHLFAFVWMPESPYYHMKRGDRQAAAKSLDTFRGRHDALDDIAEAVRRQEAEPQASYKELFIRNRRACAIFVICCLTNKFSGKNPCLFYTASIFKEAGVGLGADAAVILYTSVELVATAIATLFVDRCGKKPLILTSTAGCTISLLVIALHFYFINSFPSWLPLGGLLAYNIFFSFGLAFAMINVLGELFPTNVKAKALCLADCFSVSMGTVASKFFQITKDLYGMYVPFFCFAACCAIGFVMIVKFVPETKGKSLEEIQELLIDEQKTCEKA